MANHLLVARHRDAHPPFVIPWMRRRAGLPVADARGDAGKILSLAQVVR